MSSKYTQAENIMATQLAYLNAEPGDRAGDLVNSIIMKNAGSFTTNPDGTLSIAGGMVDGLNAKQLNVAVNMYNLNIICPKGVEGWQNWTILDVHDDENKSGYYGCLIDTGNGNAIVGSRGSESYDANQTVKDWVVADVGMLFTKNTAQEKEVAKYAKEIWEKYGNDYRYELMGHSLGGLLSFHMLITAPDEMCEYIDAAINNDGPGANNEGYVEKYKDVIEARSDKMIHYSWSWVSQLLAQGVGLTYVSAHDDESYGLLAGLGRHDTHNINYDLVKGDGSFDGNNIKKSNIADAAKIISDVYEYTFNKGSNKEKVLAFGVTLGIALAVGGLALVKNEVDSTAAELKDIYESIREEYYKRFNRVSGQYEVYPQCLIENANELRSIKNTIDNNVHEAEKLMLETMLESTCGGYYRSLVWTACAALKANAFTVGRLADKADNVAHRYMKADEEVANLFPVIKI